MSKLKIMTIVGTRPEIIRLSSCIVAFDQYFDHILTHTGQNWDYALSQIFFDEFGLRAPDYFLNSPGTNLGETMGNIISKSYDVLKKENPDAVVILGDTNSSLSAISAKRLKIPIFHMEAGNRCFDQNVPEEINRKIVDHISDVNLPYTQHSKQFLLSEGINPEHIFVTGSPMKEVLVKQKQKIQKSTVLEKLSLKKDGYFLISLHREENIDSEANFYSLMDSINKIAENYKMPIIYSVHPRSAKKISEQNFKLNPLVANLEPFGFADYNKLQINSFCVLSDSGTLSEESAILNFPAVLMRTSTERPEAMDKGTIIIGGLEYNHIVQSIEIARASRLENNQLPTPSDYGDANVSLKMVKIIQSYTSIINKVVWNK